MDIKKVKYIPFFLGLFWLLSCTAPRQYMADSQIDPDYKDSPIRIQMAYNEKSIDVNINGAFKIESLSTKSVIDSGSNLKARIEPAGKDISINGKSIHSDSIKFVSDENIVTLNGFILRGTLDVNAENNTLSAIQSVFMEEYLYSIVGREMSESSPIEALKAQTVAARTFILNDIAKNKRYKRNYDIDNLKQVPKYTGMNKEKPNIIKAVNLTKGIVLKYHGEYAFLPFHSNCGGYTEDAKEVWGGDSFPYLSAGPCHFCNGRKESEWSVEIQKDHIIESLRSKGYELNDVYDIDARYDTTKAGRARKIKIRTDKATIAIDINTLRLIVGSDALKSAKSLTARSRGNSFVFTGKGWGHGVGMCQDGAEGMAKAGMSYKDILRKYYVGLEMTTR